MIVLAESTFDVDRAFHLEPGAPSPLFERDRTTRALGPLFVNAVGGGTCAYTATSPKVRSTHASYNPVVPRIS